MGKELQQAITVRPATAADVDAVAALYGTLQDYLATQEDYTGGWRRGVYPLREDAEAGFAQNALYVAEMNGEIVGTCILLPTQGEVYRTVSWALPFDVPVLVVHTFLAHPGAFGRGVGAALLHHAEAVGRACGARCIRLDTYEKNAPACRLYTRCGYTYRGTIDLGIEKETGLKWFKVFEKQL